MAGGGRARQTPLGGVELQWHATWAAGLHGGLPESGSEVGPSSCLSSPGQAYTTASSRSLSPSSGVFPSNLTQQTPPWCVPLGGQELTQWVWEVDRLDMLRV